MDVSMSSLEVGATEDVIRALLNYLVDPLLPTVKSYARAPPSLSQQEAVAKQVHALVLIYNYYLRKSHRELEFLRFESFVKLTVILKPSLMAHMKLMHRSDIDEVEDLENQLSKTEKAIMDACDISSTLDPSKDNPDIDGWPICKVAVMLVDSRKENCFLLCNSVTYGVCSVIEKDVCLAVKRTEAVLAGRHISKRIRTNKKISNGQLATDEAGLQQLAFSAVKEAAGIDQTDLMVLESHVVYSLSKERAATRFYIMQCTKFIKEDLQVPLLEVIKSLQSPLVQMISLRWMMTPAVKYFYMLPYAGILSDWLSRKVLSNNFHVSMAETGTLMVHSSEWSEDRCYEDLNINENYGVSDTVSNEANAIIEAQKQDNNHRCLMNPLSTFAEQPVINHVDNSPLHNCGIQDRSKGSTVHQKKKTTYKENTMGPPESGHDDQSQRIQNVQDEVGVCNKSIQVTNGVQDGLAIKMEADVDIKIEADVDGGKDVYPESITESRVRTYQHLEEQDSTVYSRRKRLSEASLGLQNPCQVLDEICYKRNWRLPTYCVSPSDGGEFIAKVTLKGTDFEFSFRSDTYECPLEARESAAAKMVNNFFK